MFIGAVARNNQIKLLYFVQNILNVLFSWITGENHDLGLKLPQNDENGVNILGLTIEIWPLSGRPPDVGTVVLVQENSDGTKRVCLLFNSRLWCWSMTLIRASEGDRLIHPCVQLRPETQDGAIAPKTPLIGSGRWKPEEEAGRKSANKQKRDVHLVPKPDRTSGWCLLADGIWTGSTLWYIHLLTSHPLSLSRCLNLPEACSVELIVGC